jgi:dienelactone hydrolase
MKPIFSLALLAACLSLVAAEPPQPDVIAVNYTDDGFQLQGYLSLPAVTPAPAVVIIPDWDGVNFYEQQRATMIAKELGYVGFAADIYGADKHEVEDIDERKALATHYRSNSTLFTSRIKAAVDTVKDLSEVDSGNVAVIGYCFGGTFNLCVSSGECQCENSNIFVGVLSLSVGSGVITYGLVGADDVVALASFHGGLGDFPEAGPVVKPPLLILSGGDDDASTDIVDLEETLNAANASWEITRYSGIEHAFTVFDDDRYNEWADQRSWESMTGFLQEAFGEVPFDGMMPDSVSVTPIDYTDVDGAELRGYLSLPSDDCVTPTPAVVILPDWDGVNNYEQLRATMLADNGYVAFAADIFGKDLQANLTIDERVELVTLYRSNTTLFVQRIQRAIEALKENIEVDPDKIAVIGYCFGGTGIIEYAFSGRDDVEIVVSFHGGLQSLPNTTVDIKPYVLVLSGGIDDAHGNQTELEMSLDNATADWEVTRYAQVEHGFTAWDGEGYNLMADARSWASMMLAFDELLPVSCTGSNSTGSLNNDSQTMPPSMDTSAAPSFAGSFSIACVTLLAMPFLV